jgi:hypothetical protein
MNENPIFKGTEDHIIFYPATGKVKCLKCTAEWKPANWAAITEKEWEKWVSKFVSYHNHHNAKKTVHIKIEVTSIWSREAAITAVRNWLDAVDGSDEDHSSTTPFGKMTIFSDDGLEWSHGRLDFETPEDIVWLRKATKGLQDLGFLTEEVET